MGDSLLHMDYLDTPIGQMLLLSDGDNLLRNDYMTENKLQETERWAAKHFKNSVIQQKEDTVLIAAKKQLTEYFIQDRSTFDIAFRLQGTPFQMQVWQALYHKVAHGQTKTYKDLAIAIDSPRAVRAVGGAVNKNPLSIIVPCHRIVGSNGKLVGYNGGLDKKQYLLDLELSACFS